MNESAVEHVIVTIHSAWNVVYNHGKLVYCEQILSYSPLKGKMNGMMANNDELILQDSDAIYLIRVPQEHVILMNPEEGKPRYRSHSHDPNLIIAKASAKQDGHEWIVGESTYWRRREIEAFYRTGSNVEPCK